MLRPLIAIALSAVNIAGVASAQPDLSTAVRIKVAAADLQTRDGAKRLALRVRIAADHVCGVDEDSIVRTSHAFLSCRDAAIDRAIRNLDAPLLAAALGRSPQVLARADH